VTNELCVHVFENDIITITEFVKFPVAYSYERKSVGLCTENFCGHTVLIMFQSELSA